MDRYVCLKIKVCGIEDNYCIDELLDYVYYVPEDGDIYGFWIIDGSFSEVFDGVYNSKLLHDDENSFIKQIFWAKGEVEGEECKYVYVCFDATCKPTLFRVMHEASKVLKEKECYHELFKCIF